MKMFKEIVSLVGPHEIIALVLFLSTVMIWGVTLQSMYR